MSARPQTSVSFGRNKAFEVTTPDDEQQAGPVKRTLIKALLSWPIVAAGQFNAATKQLATSDQLLRRRKVLKMN
jgi:hypothetical protein